MNCVQCGEALAAGAKFCRKCGCKVQTAVAPETAASPRNMPAAPVAAYATCPDCGALCKGQALFCKQCGCRFEETPGFQDTAPDWDAPLSVAEEKAILVFGNVQDSSLPPSSLPPGERIQTSAAMVIGGAAASPAAAVPAPALREPEVPLWETDAAARRAPPVAPDTHVRPRASAQLRNPMPEAPQPPSGQGLRIVLALLGVAVLAGGGAWWWKSQQGRPAGGAVAAPSVSAPAAPAQPVAADAAVPVESAAPAMVATDAALAPNETLLTPAPAEDAAAAAVAVEEAPAPAPAPARPAVRKPARKQTLDDLLN
ncbi:double zinc ribbon domain-containing protein [Comamonas sp. MYb69]|uniref:double zinc ribbon domain-containing protein n=1 Tax=Comamonas sp. MYb69 TaxID=1848650 RepID=UPI00309E7C48